MSYIEFTAQTDLQTEDEDALTKIWGTIFAYATDESHIEIGKLTAFRLDVYQWESFGEHIFSLFDLDEDLPIYYRALYDEDDWFIVGDNCYSDILIVNNLQIKPYFRGLKIGLAAVYQTIEMWGRECSIVAINPFPLHLTYSGQNLPDWFKEMDMGRYPTDPDEATQKLRRYYAQLGFAGIEGSPVMYLNRDMRRPSLKDIGYDSYAVLHRAEEWEEMQWNRASR